MSMSIRVSPQSAKILISESLSTRSDATVVLMRIKKSYNRKPSYYSSYASKAIPSGTIAAVGAVGASDPNNANNDSAIINIIHDAGGAKAPYLVCEGYANSP